MSTAGEPERVEEDQIGAEVTSPAFSETVLATLEDFLPPTSPPLVTDHPPEITQIEHPGRVEPILWSVFLAITTVAGVVAALTSGIRYLAAIAAAYLVAGVVARRRSVRQTDDIVRLKLTGSTVTFVAGDSHETSTVKIPMDSITELEERTLSSTAEGFSGQPPYHKHGAVIYTTPDGERRRHNIWFAGIAQLTINGVRWFRPEVPVRSWSGPEQPSKGGTFWLYIAAPLGWIALLGAVAGQVLGWW